MDQISICWENANLTSMGMKRLRMLKRTVGHWHRNWVLTFVFTSQTVSMN
ncbi:UNVERIFIED_CONTAM: hypothetical protein GTU68_060148 [Idotea baltica]|nr:hypothetical protein [Idotea baltica]